jgi:pilus assembly protein Flp/PilA
MKRQFVAFLLNQSGATAIEYGIIASMIAVAIISAVVTVGTNLSGTFNGISNDFRGS